MTARFVAASVVIGLVGATPSVWAQGGNSFQAGGGRRTVTIMTPGSLYKSPTFNPGSPGTFNKPAQSTSRGSSSLPQNSAVSQPLSKPATVAVSQPSSSFGAAKSTAPQPSYRPTQTLPQASVQRPSYNMGQSSTPATPSYTSPLMTTPLQQPVFSTTPQFSTVSPSTYGGQPNASPAPPPKPIYTMERPPATIPSFSIASSPSGAAATPPPALRSPYMPSPPPISTAPSRVAPLAAPANTSLQQPFYVPENPFVVPRSPQR